MRRYCTKQSWVITEYYRDWHGVAGLDRFTPSEHLPAVSWQVRAAPRRAGKYLHPIPQYVFSFLELKIQQISHLSSTSLSSSLLSGSAACWLAGRSMSIVSSKDILLLDWPLSSFRIFGSLWQICNYHLSTPATLSMSIIILTSSGSFPPPLLPQLENFLFLLEVVSCERLEDFSSEGGGDLEREEAVPASWLWRKEVRISLTSSLLELGGMAQGVIWTGEKCLTKVSSSARLAWLE